MTAKGVSLTFGQRLAQARRELAVRERRDIMQKDVADAIGASAASVSRWEADIDAPREATLAKLAKFLGVTPAYLRYGVTEEHPPVVYAKGEVVAGRGAPADQKAAKKRA